MTNLSWFERNPFLLKLAQILIFGLVTLGIDYFTEDRPLTLGCAAIVLYLIIVAAATQFQYHPITVMWERVKIYCSWGSDATFFGRCSRFISVRRVLFFFLVSCGVVASERNDSETCGSFFSVRCLSYMILFWAGFMSIIVCYKLSKL